MELTHHSQDIIRALGDDAYDGGSRLLDSFLGPWAVLLLVDIIVLAVNSNGGTAVNVAGGKEGVRGGANEEGNKSGEEVDEGGNQLDATYAG